MATATPKTENIRNICLLGHGGNGKTSVAEAMLYISGSSDRLGKISDGTTVCDYDPEEIKRKFSISTSIAPAFYNDKKINIIDTPGYLDFSGEVMQGLRVSGCALIVMDAKSGVDAGCELAWEYATEATVPKAFFINKIDDENANFSAVIDSMREKFGKTICPVTIPIFENRKTSGIANLIKNKAYAYDGKEAKEINIDAKFADNISEARALLMESLASTSDELMEKFFAEEEFTEEEMTDALSKGINDRSIAPVMVGSALTLDGISSLLYIIAKSFPNPFGKKHERDLDNNYVKIDPEGSPAVFVFKTVADPFVGKMSYFKVMNGTLKRDMTLKNLTTGENEKFAHIYVIKGKKQTEVDELACGDIGVTAKLANTNTNDTLSASGNTMYKKIEYKKPYYGMGIVPSAKGDEDKISSGISKLLEEDLTLRYENNRETKQMLIYGLGEQHLDIIVSKLKTRFGTTVQLTQPKIAYRETIKKKIDAEGKHKKQSGGHGQYGHVKIHFAPGDNGLVFSESTFGGSVPKNFHPAVEKGLLECMQKGVLAGFPMVGLCADLYDGSFHDVDSSEMAFKMAAALAYKELKNANPAILEPVGSLKVYVPDEYMGDIIGDISKRRGRILGTGQAEKAGVSIVEAEVPQSEMANYTISLRAMTQGRGSFDYEFVRYEEVPGPIAQKIIDENKISEE